MRVRRQRWRRAKGKGDKGQGETCDVGESYPGAVPLLRLDLGADQLVGRLHGFRVGLAVAGDDVVQLEAKGHQPAVHICRERGEVIRLCLDCGRI